MTLENTVVKSQRTLEGRKSEIVEAPNKETPDFICRVCGSKEFKEVYRSSEIISFGGRNRRIYCVCNGCSVLFEDPKKFSKK
ncbi:MAG: hypothetical protein HW401_897 [Parcubacteria group bacterium]|nr:hypothetical protein [Parcubacteria group bacterium]